MLLDCSAPSASRPNDLDRQLEALKHLRARFGQAERRPDAVERLAAGQDLGGAGGCADSRRDVHAFAAVIAHIGARLESAPCVQANPDVGRDDLGVERTLNRDGGLRPDIGVFTGSR